MKLILFPATLLLLIGTVNHKLVDSIRLENTNPQSEANNSEFVLAAGPTLILDHVFTYNNPMVTYTITVRGEIPIKEEPVGVVNAFNKQELNQESQNLIENSARRSHSSLPRSVSVDYFDISEERDALKNKTLKRKNMILERLQNFILTEPFDNILSQHPNIYQG